MFRFEFGCCVYQIKTIRNNVDHQELWFQNVLARVSHKLVIVGDKNACSRSLFSQRSLLQCIDVFQRNIVVEHVFKLGASTAISFTSRRSVRQFERIFGFNSDTRPIPDISPL